MSRSLNKVMIIGHLGRDPEMRYTPSGRPVTTFSVATNRTWNTASGDKRSETEWFSIVAWGNLAEICNQYLSKSQQVYIEGRLHTRHWENSNGDKHSSVEIVANEMMMLGNKPNIRYQDTDELDDDDDYDFLKEDGSDEEYLY